MFQLIIIHLVIVSLQGVLFLIRCLNFFSLKNDNTHLTRETWVMGFSFFLEHSCTVPGGTGLNIVLSMFISAGPITFCIYRVGLKWRKLCARYLEEALRTLTGIEEGLSGARRNYFFLSTCY